MEFFRRIQQLLADPNLAFLFMSLGTLAIVYELSNPGIGAGGVLGAIFIVLALFSLSVLPVSMAGVVLLLVAAALFAAELFAPGIGIAAAGGAIALMLSGVFLFRDTPGIRVSFGVMIPVTLVVGVGVVLAGRLVVQQPARAIDDHRRAAVRRQGCNRRPVGRAAGPGPARWRVVEHSKR